MHVQGSCAGQYSLDRFIKGESSVRKLLVADLDMDFTASATGSGKSRIVNACIYAHNQEECLHDFSPIRCCLAFLARMAAWIESIAVGHWAGNSMKLQRWASM